MSISNDRFINEFIHSFQTAGVSRKLGDLAMPKYRRDNELTSWVTKTETTEESEPTYWCSLNLGCEGHHNIPLGYGGGWKISETWSSLDATTLVTYSKSGFSISAFDRDKKDLYYIKQKWNEGSQRIVDLFQDRMMGTPFLNGEF